MKKILITGVNSYIGNSFIKWLNYSDENYIIETISLKNDLWREKDFSKFDVLFHVAGIAHVSSDPNLEELYYKINRDLTIEVAKRSKEQGVKQFVFMSSIIVYGTSNNIIDVNTIPKPDNFYGNSKLLAEEGINKLNDQNFKVVIIRPPMIYGKGSKGNYSKLAKLAQKTFLFPNIENKRSMLHVDNLCEFLRLIIEHEESGVFFPQNKEYVKTSELVREIAQVHGKRVKLTKVFNKILLKISSKSGMINKLFGDLVYEKKLSRYKENYRVLDFQESIQKTEGK